MANVVSVELTTLFVLGWSYGLILTIGGTM
jgi:hypothetical protein